MDTWAVEESGFDGARLGFWEAVFTLGNGYVGMRGVLEEGYAESYPATYFAGVYDKGEHVSFEIVNAPNPLLLEMVVDGRGLSADEMEVVEHTRRLNLREGVLTRRTVFRAQGRRYEYESERFLSMADVHVGAVRVRFTSLDADVEVCVRASIDGTTENRMHAVGGPVKHYSVVDAGIVDDTTYLLAQTHDLEMAMGFGSWMSISKDGEPVPARGSDHVEHERCTQELCFTARKGKTYQLERLISMCTSTRDEAESVKDGCLEVLRAARQSGMDALWQEHVEAWSRLWHASDIEIEGDEQLQRALRFDMYHLLISAREGIDAGIGAKALSGEWYGGHVFWDMDIYMLPFFIYTQPERARSLLLYRYRRLDRALERARRQGYRGALWPWESAFSGEDETPESWVDPHGNVIPVYTGRREHHIAADVAYGLIQYYRASGDEEFMLSYGAEMLFETARFWASRVQRDEQGRFEIKDVIGPNEFQSCVDNNAYTNGMAAWVLDWAHGLYHHYRKTSPRGLSVVAQKIGLEMDEVEGWKDISERIFLPIRSDGLIEEFEGYLEKQDVVIDEWDERGMPVVSVSHPEDTQLVKQADVVLLLYLLSERFSSHVKRVSLDYYEQRTAHASSLSHAPHALVACELGDTARAYRYALLSANV
ncbi:MAG: glycoside hydrolase family 65 protein, partial [Methermicoccaceae archaeon]